jgi:hypothetical protein
MKSGNFETKIYELGLRHQNDRFSLQQHTCCAKVATTTTNWFNFNSVFIEIEKKNRYLFLPAEDISTYVLKFHRIIINFRFYRAFFWSSVSKPDELCRIDSNKTYFRFYASTDFCAST